MRSLLLRFTSAHPFTQAIGQVVALPETRVMRRPNLLAYAALIV